MSNISQLLLVSILIFSTCSKFSESPDHSFVVWDRTKNGTLTSIGMSTDDDKLAVISFNANTLRSYQTIYKFDGSTECNADYAATMLWASWPSKTNGLFADALNRTLLKAASPCSSPLDLGISFSDAKKVVYTHTSKESYVAFAQKSNKIVEYNLGSGALSRQFTFDNTTEQLVGADYSPDHDYLYGITITNDKFKIVIFDASSGERKKQIYTDLTFFKGNADGDGFIAADVKGQILYAVDKDGNKKQIWAPSSDPTVVEAPAAICTNDLKLIAMRASGSDQNPKVEIVSYDSDDGSESQTFEINFIPNLNFDAPFTCNDNYLLIYDTAGTVHLFEYSHSLPVWAIILIVVGSLLIIGGGVAGIIIYKRRKSQKDQGYQQFSNEQKARNDL